MTKEEQATKYYMIGLAAEKGFTDEMRHYHAELQILYAAAKEKGEKNQAAFCFAMALFSLEVQGE